MSKRRPPAAAEIGPEKIAANLEPLITPIDAVHPDPANLRKHPTRSIEAVRSSLTEFGQMKPIVASREGTVIAGNGTLEAARAIGWKRIAVVRADHLNADQLRAYAIADNRTGELSSWDDDALRQVLASMGADMRTAAGFDAGEFADLMHDGSKPMEQDKAPAPLPYAVAKRGEIWQLGEHRIMCGDSTNPEDVLRLMGNEKAALVATDPPYLVDYTGERVNNSGKDWSASYKEIEIPDADPFFRALFKNILEVIAPHAAIYCWHAHRRVGMIQRVWEDLDILDHQEIVWIKPTPVFGACMYHFQHEPCIMGWRRGSKPRHDGRHQVTSVWVVPWDPYVSVTYSEDADTWMIDWEGKARPVKNEHPTEKPLEIFARPMRKHTQAGDVVFEPFSGSGSQLVAAHKLARRCRAIEIEPVFVDVAIRRWQLVAGEPARLLGPDGPTMTWEEARSQRAPSGPSPAPAPETGSSRPRGRKKKNPPAPASADTGGAPAGAQGTPAGT